MTLLYYDPVFMEHRTGQHPENPGRLQSVVKHLHFVGLNSMCGRPAWQAATDDQVARVHDPDYVRSIDSMATRGGGWIDEDTRVSPRSLDVAKLAAGAAVDAVDRVLDGQDINAMVLSRPPGHHATSDQAMGFCLLNHVAIAARHAIVRHDLHRVLIVDFDVHHGNGTQDIFYDEATVAFMSMHRSPFYPNTGRADETGRGDGLGATLNLPIAMGTSPADQLAVFETQLNELADRMRPELILVSAGFDSHRSDPVGSLGLETEDFATFAERVMAVARRHCGGKLVNILEGGYDPKALTDSVTLYLETIMAD